MSISKRAYRLAPAGGAPPATSQILFTTRVDAARKAAIHFQLDRYFGISPPTVYPDLTGFVKYS
jgi:hypothetical protein